jgi:RNA polymerase sigma-70 factor, ECF subfamily
MEPMDSLFHEHYSGLYRLAVRFLHNPEDAADVLQDTYMIAQREHARHDLLAMENPRAWLYRVTANLCLNQIHKTRRIRDLLTINVQHMLHRIHGTSQRQNPEETAIMEEEKNLFVRAYQKLSPKNRMLLDLFHSGLNYAEIAIALSITKESVGNKLYRVRARLSMALNAKE